MRIQSTVSSMRSPIWPLVADVNVRHDLLTHFIDPKFESCTETCCVEFVNITHKHTHTTRPGQWRLVVMMMLMRGDEQREMNVTANERMVKPKSKAPNPFDITSSFSSPSTHTYCFFSPFSSF